MPAATASASWGATRALARRAATSQKARRGPVVAAAGVMQGRAGAAAEGTTMAAAAGLLVSRRRWMAAAAAVHRILVHCHPHPVGATRRPRLSPSSTPATMPIMLMATRTSTETAKMPSPAQSTYQPSWQGAVVAAVAMCQAMATVRHTATSGAIRRLHLPPCSSCSSPHQAWAAATGSCQRPQRRLAQTPRLRVRLVRMGLPATWAAARSRAHLGTRRVSMRVSRTSQRPR
mmetsp:Transcript_17466/g.43974  ORF Transcript_17466/g.43974 Transcript_17466/m.43974 type:complete len:232 (-) Transcript_17466:702-1397(-)